MLCLLVALFGQERVAGWIEAIGAQGILQLAQALQ